MTLQLHMHPLSSYCHKVLIALYEIGAPFEPVLVNLGDPDARARFLALSPLGKMPVLRDQARGRTVAESSIIIEYLDRHYPGAAPLLPADPDLALETRLKDRFYDGYVHLPMQTAVGDRIRPADRRDPHGVDAALSALRTAYAIIDAEMAGRTWAAGEAFTLADCAAAPALFYANKVAPFDPAHANLAAYVQRLGERPSYARVLAEARPYLHMFPG